MFHSEDKYFASSEGSSIQQLIVQTFANISANAVDVEKRLSKSRTYMPAAAVDGLRVRAANEPTENAQRIREEVLEHLAAPAVQAGKKDLVLMPSHLFPHNSRERWPSDRTGSSIGI